MSANGFVTRRDYFAARCPDDLAKVRVRADAETLAGWPYPEDGGIEAQCKWNAAVEARLRFIYADAMVKERDE